MRGSWKIIAVGAFLFYIVIDWKRLLLINLAATVDVSMTTIQL